MFPPTPTSPLSTKIVRFPARPSTDRPVPIVKSPASALLAPPANRFMLPPRPSVPKPAASVTLPASPPIAFAPLITSEPAVLFRASCLFTTYSPGPAVPSVICPLIATLSVSASPRVTSCSTLRLDSKFAPPVTVMVFSNRKLPSVLSSSRSESTSRNPWHGCFPVNIFVNARSLNVAVVLPYTPM